jgi:hypothetical protein
MAQIRIYLAAAVAVLFLFPCCQAGKELHFFKAGGNYYRLKIHEMSFASKSRYMSGFYDDRSVDRYFSELSQPKGTDSEKMADVTFINPANGQGLALDSNKKLVMILSTNSDAVSEQIGAFAQNDQILESIARLSNKDKVDASNQFLQNISFSHMRNQSIISLGDQYLAGLADTDNAVTVRNNLSGFLQNLKTLTASKSNITGIDLLLHEIQP